MTTREAIVEMLERINGVCDIYRTEEEIQKLSDDLWKVACEVEEIERAKRLENRQIIDSVFEEIQGAD